MTTPRILTYEGEPSAAPAFRTMAWIEGSLSDQALVEKMIGFYDLFVDRFAGPDLYLMQGGRGKGGKTVQATPKALENARDWLMTPPHNFPTTLRLATYDEPSDLTTVPFFRIEEGSGMVLLEFDQRPDSPDLTLAARLAGMLMDLPLICAVQGYGFHLGGGNDSLIWTLPQTTSRYRCAIEIQLDGPAPGIRKEGSFFPYERHPKVQPGIADIGWRTFIGAAFLDRIPDIDSLQGADEITVERRNGNVVITAGMAPIWGDLNRNEDISAYREIARVLAPAEYPLEIAKGSLFGDATGDPDRVDRLTAYLDRFN